MKRFFALKAVALSLFLPFTATQVQAEGWSVYYLGDSDTRDRCMSHARSVINGYIFKNGGGNTSEASWTVYGYDLEPGDQDIVIMCPVTQDGSVAAIMNVHGETTEEQRIFVADTIESMWEK